MAHGVGLAKARPPKVGGEKTKPALRDNMMGYTSGRTVQEKEANFRGQSTFGITPRCHVADKVGAFICDVSYRISNRTRQASLDMSTVTNLKLVMQQLKDQHTDEVIMAPNLSDKDFSCLMEAALGPLLEDYSEAAVKKPVESIGVQAQLWTDNIMDMSQKDLEFFFNADQGVLGIDALPHKDPQTIYHEPALRGIPTIEFEPAGVEGLNKLFSRPLINGSGPTYYETVACSLCVAFASFHGQYNMHVFGKKPLNVIEGEPNMSKSKGQCEKKIYIFQPQITKKNNN